MKEYFLKVDDDGKILALEEIGEELEECDGCEQLEAAMLAIIGGLREEIAVLKARVSDLEKRPILEAEPLYPTLAPPYVITCNTTSQVDPTMLSKTIANSIYKAMRT